MLFNLARLLAQHAFRDYITYEDLMAIEPPEDGELMPLPWKDELLETPFFINESTGKIETANSYSNRDRDACRRAGYPDGIRNHDFRREGLHQISTCRMSPRLCSQLTRLFKVTLSRNLFDNAMPDTRTQTYRPNITPIQTPQMGRQPFSANRAESTFLTCSAHSQSLVTRACGSAYPQRSNTNSKIHKSFLN